jgi:hypothetical protein
VRDEGKRFAIIVDEVQDLFLLPDHYGESVLMTFQESFESIYCLHIFTGSAVRIMSCDVFGYASPLFGRVTQMLLDPLKPADDFALMDKLAREFDLTWEEDAQFLLHELAGGHPFYTTCVVSRLAEEGTRHVTPERVREAFLTDLLQGRMFLEFVDRTDPHLKAMGEVEAAVGILKALVNSEENAVSTEDLKPLPGYSFEVLENLARADVIRLNGWSARMLDPAYKMWLRDVYLHLFWGRQSQVDARRSLAATVGRLCNDLGRLYESKVQDVMWFFQRQTVEGRFFGHPGTSVTLPTFEEVARRVTYAERLPEAIEIDVHGHYPHPQFIYAYWFVECKYQEEQPDREDFERLLHKRELFIRFSFQTDITLWFCTKHPLSEELADWAREQGVYFSSEADLEALFAALRAGVSR